jgi:hypothetical protein
MKEKIMKILTLVRIVLLVRIILSVSSLLIALLPIWILYL